MPEKFGSRPVRAVIFDFDGTLVDSYEHLHRGIIKGMEKHSKLGRNGLEQWKKEFTLSGFWKRMNWDSFIKEAHERAGIKLSNKELLGLRKKIEAAEDEEGYHSTFYSDVKPSLEHLNEKGLILSVSSFSNKNRLLSRLSTEGLIDYFDTELIYGREDSRDRSQRLQLLLDKLKAKGIKPNECLLVGDMPSDALAGLSKGTQVVVVRRKVNGKYIIPKKSFAGFEGKSLVFIDSLKELLEKFK
ncbi:MAG: HAD family phosphatase [Candidatus Diapherotrites archaeon]|nr:HAD family phosphatase [Candidatus Diapherotrites archaeon]